MEDTEEEEEEDDDEDEDNVLESAFEAEEDMGADTVSRFSGFILTKGLKVTTREFEFDETGFFSCA